MLGCALIAYRPVLMGVLTRELVYRIRRMFDLDTVIPTDIL